MRLRLKLAIICWASVAIPLLLASIFIVSLVSSSLRGKSIERLRAQSAAAFSLYQKRAAEMQSAAETLADNIGAKSMLALDNPAGIDVQSRARLQDLLSSERDRLSLDFLIVADPSGHVIARQNDSPAAGESITAPGKSNPVVEAAIAEGSRLQRGPVAACGVEQSDFLSRMWLDKAAKVQGASLDEAALIEAGAPIIASDRFLGLVFTGQMLNNYYVAPPGSGDLQVPLVSEIRRDLFADSDQAGAVIALGDTIVASSVFKSGGGEPVLRGAGCDHNRTFQTITDGGLTYAVAWLPMKSLDGASIGAIGVAAQNDRLNEGPSAIALGLLAAGLVGSVAAGLSGFAFGEMLSSRLRALIDAVSRMSLGELSAEVRDRPKSALLNGMMARLPAFRGPRNNPTADGNGTGAPDSSDEISLLTNQLEHMRGSFRMAIERLRRR